MNTDFDTLWKTRNETHCPLSDQQLSEMIDRAKSQEPHADFLVLPSRHPFRRWMASLAAAAGLAILIIPTTMMNAQAAVPQQIDYHGQQVKFICNNRCNAENVIQSLDSYIQKGEK